MKLKFDNQILMQRLGDYKKAEKGAKDLCQEYETMKLKYFNVLTENERQKSQISDYIQQSYQKDQELIILREAKAQLTQDLQRQSKEVMSRLKNVQSNEKYLQDLQA